jgi:hypothetical protein
MSLKMTVSIVHIMIMGDVTVMMTSKINEQYDLSMTWKIH